MHRTLVQAVVALFLIVQAHALHFYVKTGEVRCFFEDLPANTLLVGRIDATELQEQRNEYVRNHNLRVEITIDVRVFCELIRVIFIY